MTDQRGTGSAQSFLRKEAKVDRINPLETLIARGFVQDCTDPDGLSNAFSRDLVTAYVGFDPTAASLHVGNLMGIMMLATLQRCGHRPIILGGGGTALIGDPSGKTKARSLLTPADITANLAAILPQFGRYVDFTGERFVASPAALLVNNADWLLDLSYIAFLRDIGVQFSVNQLLTHSTYRERMANDGLSFIEFNYVLLQAYDFLHLFRTNGCLLQMGGADQWFNIVAGTELIRRLDGTIAFGLVSPLITTASGAKMGKSETGAIWLDPARTSPFDFFQYWINCDDADVARFLRLYTFLPEDQIADLTSVSGAALREAKATLARAVTALNHGEAAAEDAREAARILFRRGNVASEASMAVPQLTITLDGDVPAVSVADLFVRSGLCSSRSAVRRQASQGGVAIDGKSVTDVNQPIGATGSVLLLRAGKKRYRRVVIIG